MRILFLTLIALLSSAPSLQATEPADCELAIPCQIGNRSFHARVPDGWDGKTPLPVLLHFHGWGRQAPLIMNHSRIAGATRKMGVLLLAPNGLGQSWRFWTRDTEDVGFTDAVLEEAAIRWPIDRSKIFVSGYSYGSAMAWRYACARGEKINTLLAVSGSLPDRDETCKTPVRTRHVHGTRDTVMDYPYGPDGDVKGAVALWRQQNGCQEKPDNTFSWHAVKALPFKRHVWDNCSSGKSVVLDVHQRGHFIPRHWIAKQLEELL